MFVNKSNLLVLSLLVDQQRLVLPASIGPRRLTSHRCTFELMGGTDGQTATTS